MKVFHYKKKLNLSLGIVIIFIFLSGINVNSSLFSKEVTPPFINLGLENMNYGISLNNAPQININTSSEFRMHEFANISSSKENISSIDINVPSSDWNLTNIELNFTDIRLKQETITLASQDDVSDVWVLKNGEYEQLAMQMEVTESIKLISIDIYGFSSQIPEVDEVFVKITGWDDGNNEPDTTKIYGDTIPLNISNTPQWFEQKFAEPIDLEPDNYAIVLDGYPEIGNDIQYYWFINETNPNSLTMSYWDYRFFQGGWDWYSIAGDVFCHRINQFANRSYRPTEINMSAVINEKSYSILNGVDEGMGYLNLPNLDFPIPGTILQIEISTNESIQLSFNLNYSLSINDFKNVDLWLKIEKVKANEWIIVPNITRYSFYYSVAFEFPINWNNVNVFRNGLNISEDSGVLFENDILTIDNNTITPNSTWLISANSEQKDFALSSSAITFNPADKLEIKAETSFGNGELRFSLIDSNNQEIYEEIRSLSLPTEKFSYVISSGDRAGIWNAILIWYNQTDAGFASLTFNVELPFVLEPLSVFFISIGIVGAVSSGYGSYKLIKRRKQTEAIKKRKIIDKCMDIVNLKSILVTDRNSSLTLFEGTYVEKGLDSNLISGFLQAIRSFGIELTESQESSQIIKLEYQKLKIIMDEYGDFRIILIMKEIPSIDFLDSVKDLSYELKEKFEKYISNFNGNIKPFKYIDRLIVKHLNGELLYPLKLDRAENSNITTEERALISKISGLLKTKNTDYIYFKDIVEEKACSPEEVLLINSLIQKGILNPILSFK
ncbi:MAG: hypothetical protein BAJALOKI3v1_160013 [Promethearchaeota archaeon]|nr:MAG: hypothetical protein BAJALOKI3v1_160013 [Candidatus Lokiarchaeota archaeon]